METDAYDEVIYNPQDYKKENLEELMEYIKAHAVQYRLPEKKERRGGTGSLAYLLVPTIRRMEE